MPSIYRLYYFGQVKDAEQRLRHKLFPPNAWMKVADFRVLTSCPKDELHQWFIGLYGEHIIPAIDGNATFTIPHKYASRQRTAFDCRCADGPGQASRKGSHVYEINTWLWSFGRPQPRVGGLSVSKAQRLRKASRSEAAKRAWVTKRARKCVAGGQ